MNLLHKSARLHLLFGFVTLVLILLSVCLTYLNYHFSEFCAINNSEVLFLVGTLIILLDHLFRIFNIVPFDSSWIGFLHGLILSILILSRPHAFVQSEFGIPPEFYHSQPNLFMITCTFIFIGSVLFQLNLDNRNNSGYNGILLMIFGALVGTAVVGILSFITTQIILFICFLFVGSKYWTYRSNYGKGGETIEKSERLVLLLVIVSLVLSWTLIFTFELWHNRGRLEGITYLSPLTFYDLFIRIINLISFPLMVFTAYQILQKVKKIERAHGRLTLSLVILVYLVGWNVIPDFLSR